MEAWLGKQPREVSVAFAPRAALRVLPVVQLEKRETYIRDLVLPVFRATAVSWAAAKYPAREKELATACRAAVAALVAQSTGSTWGSGYAAAPRRAAEFAAVVTIRDTAGADAANAAANALDALVGYAVYAYAATNAIYATEIAAAAAAPFWSAVSSDVTRVEEGATASVIAKLPLWPDGQPKPLQSLWQEMTAALLAANQDWLVWIHWYDLRLSGHCRDEERELAYVRIEEALWDQGPAIVNAEIKRRIEADTTPNVPEQAIVDVSNGTARPATKVGATKSRAVSRRPVFKGFFSYTHRDAEVDPHIVEAFSSELEKRVDANLVNARFEIWRDKDKLQVGDYWDQRIEGAIDTSHIFIIVLTPKWISSDYCRKEFGHLCT